LNLEDGKLNCSLSFLQSFFNFYCLDSSDDATEVSSQFSNDSQLENEGADHHFVEIDQQKQDKNHQEDIIDDDDSQDGNLENNTLIGNDLYSINTKSQQKNTIYMNSFDYSTFDLKINYWKYSPQSLISTIESEEKLSNGTAIGGVQKSFHTFFTKFAKEIFKDLGVIFPYLAPKKCFLEFPPNLWQSKLITNLTPTLRNFNLNIKE
jgi:hypothetical protein